MSDQMIIVNAEFVIVQIYEDKYTLYIHAFHSLLIYPQI